MAERSIDGAFESVPVHPGETSLVPRLDGEVKSTKGKKLLDSAQAASSTLRYVLDEVRAVPLASNHIPANTKCVTLKQWHEYAASQSRLDKLDSKLKAFEAVGAGSRILGDRNYKEVTKMHSIGEVVKQFELHVWLLEHAIKGKIVKYRDDAGNGTYEWSISHHYRPSAGAQVYYPSARRTETIEEAELLFRAYAESFMQDYEVDACKGF